MKKIIWTILVAVCLFFILERKGIINDEVKKDVKQVWRDTMNNLDRLDEID